MRVEPLGLEGALLVTCEPSVDERGSFTRTFDASVVAMLVEQAGSSWNTRARTLRGMHLQREPFGEAKVIRCSHGAIHDVLIDLRRSSPTHRRWVGVELRAGDGRAIFAPPGIAHGYVTLVDDTEVSYLLSKPHAPDAAWGVRWDDPAFAIDWPVRPSVIAERDSSWPDYDG